MQFKVVSALIFATLAAASALPPADSNPTNTNADLAKTGGSGNTNQGTTNPVDTNNGNTNHATDISPPFPGSPLPTIAPSKCSEGHLRCCKSAQSPTAPAATPLLQPLGISASSISGLVGVTCSALSLNAKPDDCPDKPACCTDNSHGTLSLGCNLVNLSL